MTTLCRRLLCLLLLLVAVPVHDGLMAAAPEEDVPYSALSQDPIFPIAFRYRAQLLDEIAAAPTLLAVTDFVAFDCPLERMCSEAVASNEYPVSTALMYVHMSLQV